MTFLSTICLMCNQLYVQSGSDGKYYVVVVKVVCCICFQSSCVYLSCNAMTTEKEKSS